MGIQTDLVAGLGALLADEGAITWDDTGAVPTGSVPPPGYHQAYPETPDVAAAFTTYAAGGDEPTLSGTVLMLQVRSRSSRTDLTSGDDLDDAIAQALLGRYPTTLDNGVRISTLVRVSGTPIGRDSVGRMERTTNYRLLVHDPGPYRG